MVAVGVGMKRGSADCVWVGVDAVSHANRPKQRDETKATIHKFDCIAYAPTCDSYLTTVARHYTYSWTSRYKQYLAHSFPLL